MAQKDKEVIDKLLSLAGELDKDRATVGDLNTVAQTLTELVVSFMTATKNEKEAFFAQADGTIADALRKLEDKIDARLAKVRDGKDGKNGRDGRDGRDGADGKDGETPDVDEIVLRVLDQVPEQVQLLGEDMRNALEALPEGDKLSIDAIEGLWDELKKLKKTVSAGQVYGSAPAMASNPPRHEAFTMDGATSIVILTQGVAAQGTAVFVRYQGQLLDHGTQYTVNGNTITLTDLPENGTIVSVTYWTF